MNAFLYIMLLDVETLDGYHREVLSAPTDTELQSQIFIVMHQPQYKDAAPPYAFTAWRPVLSTNLTSPDLCDFLVLLSQCHLHLSPAAAALIGESSAHLALPLLIQLCAASLFDS